jgi:hypothetical protein
MSQKMLPGGVARVLKRLHFPLNLILRCVRWCVAYSLSLRDLEEKIVDTVLRPITRPYTAGSSGWCRCSRDHFASENVR